MSRRRVVLVGMFLWLGVLSGFFYKYRDDLGTIGRGLTLARGERARLAGDLAALGQTQDTQATKLVELATAVAANIERCAARPADHGDRLAHAEVRLSALAADTAANRRAHDTLRRRIFRE